METRSQTSQDSDLGRLLVLGGRHDDPRLRQLVPEQVDGEVAQVCHETPEDGREDLWHILFANPGTAVVSIPELGIATAKLLSYRMFGDGPSPTGNPRMQCLEAARELADQHDTSVEGIGLSIRERAELVPVRYTILGWISIVFLLGGILSPLAAPSIGIAAILALASYVGVQKVYLRILAIVEDQRDAGMFQNLLETSESVDGGTVVAIVGEDHVDGIADRAEAAGIECERHCLSSRGG